jgi:hypothetical protein
MSSVSSMPPISSLQRYLTDAHDSLKNRKSELVKHDKHEKLLHKHDKAEINHESSKVHLEK